MKVQELITILRSFDPELEVILAQDLFALNGNPVQDCFEMKYDEATGQIHPTVAPMSFTQLEDMPKVLVISPDVYL